MYLLITRGGGGKTRASGLIALLVLLVAAVLTLAPARAAPPDDLELELSFFRDSDGVAQPDSTIRVQARLKFTGAESVGALSLSDAALQIAGDLDWDGAGRRAIQSLPRRIVTDEYTGATGEAVAVQDGVNANAIQVVAAPEATVNDIAGGGAVHVWVNGVFKQRLTGEPAGNEGGTFDNESGVFYYDTRLNGSFGASVDVGSGVIVVGAPYEDGAPLAGGFRSLYSPNYGFGAAYVFERNGDGEWEQIAKLTVGENPAFTDPETQSAPSRFGRSVAISDDGATIVVAQAPSSVYSNHNWSAFAHVFTRPATGWADMDTNHANVTSLLHARASSSDGDVDIAGDGSVVAVGEPLETDMTGQISYIGSIHVFNRPGAAWTDGSERLLQPDAYLTATDHETNWVSVGQTIAINQSGGVIASNGVGQFEFVGFDSRDPATGWPGSAFVWVRSGGAWADSNSATATLSDSEASNGAGFGRAVAISDSGDRVVVGRRFGFDTESGAIHVFDKPGGGWADSSTADTVLGHVWPWSFAQNLALDGESTLLVGVPNPGLAGVLDLSQADPESAAHASYLRSNCAAWSSDGVVTQFCTLSFELGDGSASSIPAITIPPGTRDGAFTISAAATVDGVSYTDAVEVSVRDVDEVAEVIFGFATDPVVGYADTSDDRPYPSAIAPGEMTRLRLSVLNENGEAAGIDAANGVAEILFTTSAGSFANSNDRLAPVWLVHEFSPLRYFAVNCDGGNGQRACSVPLANLSSENADRIVISLAHPGEDHVGAAEVRATVITNNGEVFTPPPLTVTFAGRAEALVLSEPTAGVLNVDAPPDGGSEADDRDVLTLTITARDENGEQVDVPLGLPANPSQEQRNRAVRVIVRDPEGNTVPVSRYGGWDWTYDREQERTSLEFNLQINASQEDALLIGEYTLELRIGGLKAERGFRVSGGPASLALGEPEGALELNSRFTITATVADAEGNVVPDGTLVRWEARSASIETVVLVQLSADRTTTAGKASATYLAVDQGTATVAARAGGSANDATLLTIAQASPQAPAEIDDGSGDDPATSLADGLRGRTSGLAPWLGRQATTASALLDNLTGVTSIALWEAGVWLRYARVDGQVVAGSVDFTIEPGAVIALGR